MWILGCVDAATRKGAATERSNMDLEGIGEVSEVEVPTEAPIMMPPEEVVKQAGFGVRKLDTPQGTMTILTFVNTFKHYTFNFDDAGARALAEALQPSPIVRASALELPPGARAA
jgi:hypothetical protein